VQLTGERKSSGTLDRQCAITQRPSTVWTWSGVWRTPPSDVSKPQSSPCMKFGIWCHWKMLSGIGSTMNEVGRKTLRPYHRSANTGKDPLILSS
jgi:hypothetical protein